MESKMKKGNLLAAIGWVLISFLTGCTDKQTSYIDRVCLSRITQQTAVDTAENVLTAMHFTISKSDAEYGYISTQPLRGAQSFEFWRKDNVGSFNSAQSNLHTIRRTVEMNVSQQTGQICIDCIARVERLSLPERQAVSPSRAASMFTKSSPSAQRLAINPDQAKGMRWIDLGRDTALETEILNRFKQQVSNQ